MAQPKILIFDIETTANLTFTWGVGKSYLSPDSIAKERQVICIGYKWLGEKKTHVLEFDQNKYDMNKYDDDADKAILKAFSKVYAEADLAVAHNGANFDVGRLRARIVKHGLKDLAPTLIDDTYLKNRGIKFNAHRLDYLGNFLGLGRKTSTSFQLWKDVMFGSKKALKEMSSYCKDDVILLEKIYLKLLPYMKSGLNRAIVGCPVGCPSCGADSLQKRGFSYSTVGKKQRFQCKDCGHWFVDGKNLIENPKQIRRNK